MRVAIPHKLWELIVEVAEVMEATPKWCLHMMLKRIDHMVENGQVDVLGYEFAKAKHRLDNPKHSEVSAAGPIDLMKLHRSDKLKSGLVGVYANGKGFRCVGRSPTTNTLVHLGTFPSADEAAWARYLHYQKHNLPYGEYAEKLEKLSAIYTDHTEAQIRAIADAEIEEETKRRPRRVF